MIFFSFILFSFQIISILSKGCLSISSIESCITCLSSNYEKNYLSDLRIAQSTKGTLSDFECIPKLKIKAIRKIHVLNSQCLDCTGADATYENLPNAFEEEAKLAIK